MARNNVQTTVHVGMDVQLAKRNAEALKEVIATLKAELKEAKAIMDAPPNVTAFKQAEEAYNKLLIKIQTLQKVMKSATPAAAYEGFISGDQMNSNTLRQASRGAKNRLNTVRYGEGDQEARKLIDDTNAIQKQLNRLQAGFTAPFRTIKQELNNLSGGELQRLHQLLQQEQPLVKGNEKAWANYSAAIAKVEERMREYDTVARQQAGAATLAKAQGGGFAQANERDIQRAIEKLKEYRAVINDPTNTGKATYEATNAEIQKLQNSLDILKQKEKEASGESMSLANALKTGMQTLTGTFTGTTQQLQLAKKALEENLLTAKRGSAEYNNIKRALNGIELELKNTGAITQEVQAVLDAPKGKSFNALKQAVEQGRAALNNMNRTTKEGQKQFDELAKKVKQADIEMKQLAGTAKGSASSFEKAWSRLKTYISLYMGAAIAIQKIVATFGDLMTLSDKLGEVRKTTGFTADEVGRLSDNLRKLDTRTALTDLMGMASIAGSIGLKTQEQVEGFTIAANKLTVALPEMGQEAARTLMKIADATGDLKKNGGDVEDTLERVGSTIIALRANSAAAAGPITDFVSRVGAVGAQAGISIDQIAALGATVDALGGRVEMSATALSRMIPAIRNNTFEVAKAIGMTEKELKGKTGMEQMVTIFRALHDSVKGFDMTTEQGMNAAADAVENMLGKSVGMQDVMKQLNQQGARAGIVFGLLSQNVDKLEEQLRTAGKAYESNTALMSEYNKMNDTTAAKWEKLKNQIEEWFVGDATQRLLGNLIDGLRKIADWFASDGVLATGFKMMLAYAAAIRVGFGAMFVGMGGGFSKLGVALGAALNQLGLFTRATANARMEWKKLDVAVKANIWGAIISAVGFLALKLWDIHEAAKEAAAEIGRFNQKIADEQKALNNLFEPLNKSNLAQKDRLDLIKEINSKYGKYLGYMLSETSSAIQLADAHALIAKRIKEEAYERRIAEKEKKIMEEHDEDLNAAYGGIESAVRGGAKGGADVQAMADMLKSFADKNLNNVEIKWSGGYRILQDFTKDLNGMLNRMAADGKLRSSDIRQVEKAVYDYASEAKKQHNDIMSQTSNLRSDLRGIQGAIKYDLANNLNTLISNVATSVGNAVRNAQQQSTPSQQQNVPLMLQGTKGGGGVNLPSLFDGGNQQQGGWRAPWQTGGNRETTPQQQMAPAGWKPNINKKDITAVRQFVQNQDALRSALEASGQQIDEAQRKVAESWLLSDEQLKEYRKIIAKADYSPGGSKANPYGNYNKVTDPYSKWSGDDLVARRKEMLERVRALANGADVQKVLSEDAKFITDATSKNIKTTEQAIEWYNQERLKIQDALHEKHLTNTGDWLDPKKGSKKASKMVQDEMKYYLDELDAYYTERKAEIQEALNDEQISEAEARNRTLALEGEWYQRRGNLQKLYSKERKEVAEQERDAIFDILSEQTGDTVAFIEKDIDGVTKFIEKVGAEKSVQAMNKIYGDLMLGYEKSFLRSRNAIGKHIQDITNIVNKENPFNGIVKGLRENLGTMDLLLTDITDQAKRTADKEIERTMFLLEQSTKGYGLTWQELMREMAEQGWQAWGDAINADSQMQSRLMHQVYQVFEKVQDAIKKEASELKKQADIMWSNLLLPGGDGKTTIKDAFEQAVSALGIEHGRVSRANSMIGAGQASERVADKLAIKQMQVQLAMQRYQYNLVHKIGLEKIESLEKEAAAEKDAAKASALRMQADNARQALNLATRKEQTDELKLQEEIIARTEESEARLYKELREWADLLTSSLQQVFEASAAGNEEYYNERAKLNLTGKGGPGAGTYVVIDNAGTSDATAHYEYLDERQALERQHEIEQENARAEAWKKVMDDINQKMNDMITDQINAMLQNASVDANTDALLANTKAIYDSMGVETTTGETKPGQPDVIAVQPKADKPSAPAETIVIPSGTTAPSAGEQANTEATKENTQAMNVLTQVITGQPAAGPTDMGAAAGGGGGATATVDGEATLAKPFFQMTEEETALAMERIQQLWQAYNEGGVEALQQMADTLAAQEGIVLPPWQITEEGLATAMERMQTLWQAYAEQGIEAMQMMSDAMEEMPNKAPNPMGVTEQQVETSTENMQMAYQGMVDASGVATGKVISDQNKITKVQQQTNTQITKGTQSAFAKMTQAANLYGIAYSVMSNDNLSATQKFEMMAVQAAGNAAITMLTTDLATSEGKTAAQLPGILGQCVEAAGPYAGPILFAVISGVLGGLLGLAVSKIAKSKSTISQATGTSVGAGRLATGMLTYAEGNVNEFTDPDDLTPGRSYNVDAADGRTYRAKYMGSNPRTHLTNGPEFHLVGEAGREAIIDAHTTRLMQMDETGIWSAIQTLYNNPARGLSAVRRRGRGVRAFKDGNIDEFEDMESGYDMGTDSGGGMSMEQMLSFQASLDANTAIMQRLADEGIEAFVSPYGKRGIVNGYDTYKKEANRHGEKYP